ncbi:MAG: tRNA 2-selenouridine(34) synthase MnmH [Gammaproteobacteria bacterium]|nr:tRNA 2-selenouridine(34) synthase MnmH [Gammaproteobacteria bacterium]
MRGPSPITVDQRHDFDAIIDARSPAEFAIDHIPGAINCPVLDNDERRIIGTMYKQQGAFEARRVGGAMVAANIARHLKEKFADHPADWKPLVYCWRGGLRSGSLTTWLRLVGWDAKQLAGGYKSWRRHVIARIEALCPQLDLRVLCGATGSAKTRILQSLETMGHQVLDLEAFAAHKGSLLGALPGVPQPSQTAFETRIADLLDRIDPARPLYVEGESRRIGQLNVPTPLVEKMRAGSVIEIDATPQARLEYLLRDYSYLGDRPEALSTQLALLKELHGKAVIGRWQQWAGARDLRSLFAELTALHYDPAYAKSQSAHFRQWSTRRTLHVDDLSESGIAAVAERVSEAERALSPS